MSGAHGLDHVLVIGVTDDDGFNFLAVQSQAAKVNFWCPSGAAFQLLRGGSLKSSVSDSRPLASPATRIGAPMTRPVRTRPARALLVLLALAPLAAAFVRSRSVPAAAPRVRTRYGVVQGLTLPSGVRSFRGLPFAAPPVRELRWKPPQPLQPWRGVRRADRFADQCLQARVFGDMMFRNAGMSEDCLYLNVWTPATATPNANLPVLVYIHGGGFVAGDGSEPRYDGESMAKRGIVVVTLSHRLGIFGFFSHPELSAESPQQASGNYGHLDQVAALRWVRANIRQFGGDPAQITIAGESAGSFAVSALMASPMAKGLFARAIGQSGAYFGSALTVHTRAESERQGLAFAERVGAASLADLRALSATELLEASGQPGTARFLANIDGWFFPARPAEVFAAGLQAKVPLLAGWNSEEMNGRALLPRGPHAREGARRPRAAVRRCARRRPRGVPGVERGRGGAVAHRPRKRPLHRLPDVEVARGARPHERAAHLPLLLHAPAPRARRGRGDGQPCRRRHPERGRATGPSRHRGRALGGDRVRAGQPGAQSGLRLDARG